ncbi:MAG: acetylglutamate kinase [Alphaproteobacteria bacterium ADurb.Bin438]|nr:MAG: acetylglutamate kinase [Alphaproteobacteria bacterium ADurb.Bin438]
MIPKIRSCAEGIKSGVKEIFIANGSCEESILKKLVENKEVRATKIY